MCRIRKTRAWRVTTTASQSIGALPTSTIALADTVSDLALDDITSVEDLGGLIVGRWGSGKELTLFDVTLHDGDGDIVACRKLVYTDGSAGSLRKALKAVGATDNVASIDYLGRVTL